MAAKVRIKFFSANNLVKKKRMCVSFIFFDLSTKCLFCFSTRRTLRPQRVTDGLLYLEFWGGA